MIKTLKIKSDVSSANDVNYIKDIPAIKSFNGHFNFKKGLNIIVGPNGSGKSSILKLIARQMGCEFTGFSTISESWLSKLHWGNENSLNELILPAEIEHDGQPVFYCNPRIGIGELSNQISNNEFQFQIALDKMSSSESSGEKNHRLLEPIISLLNNGINLPETIPCELNLDNVNNFWIERVEQVMSKIFKPSIPKGQVTVLLDEPETGLSLLNQILLWKEIFLNKEVTDNFQIILVSHSHECINIPDAHYIELKSGYLEACRQATQGKLNFKEIKEQASVLTKPLSNLELNLLNRIKKYHEGGKVVLFKNVVPFENLINLDFIETVRRKKENTKKSNKRLGRAYNFDEICVLTHKGQQYLKFQK